MSEMKFSLLSKEELDNAIDVILMLYIWENVISRVNRLKRISNLC